MSDYVTCTIIGGVADVRLNRPERLNALDLTTLDDLVTVGESLKANRAVRAVVLSGEGRAFCAGRMVSGEEAFSLGLATRVSPAPFEAAMELAAQSAANSPHAVQGAKGLLNLAGQVPLEDGFIAEERTISALIGSATQIEAVTA